MKESTATSKRCPGKFCRNYIIFSDHLGTQLHCFEDYQSRVGDYQSLQERGTGFPGKGHNWYQKKSPRITHAGTHNGDATETRCTIQAYSRKREKRQRIISPQRMQRGGEFLAVWQASNDTVLCPFPLLPSTSRKSY